MQMCVWMCISVLSKIGMGTVSNWYRIKGFWVYGCTNTGNWMIRFISLSILKVISGMS